MPRTTSRHLLRIEGLERELNAHHEFFYCVRKGYPVVSVSNERSVTGGFAVDVIGLTRASGGVVIHGSILSLVTDWHARAIQSKDLARQDLAERVRKLTMEQLDAEKGHGRNAPRSAARALVETINATGGITEDEEGQYVPVGDPNREWSDLADAYVQACAELGMSPVVADAVDHVPT